MEVREGALEGLVSIHSSKWEGRPVLVTGHTGFKGGWLALWLHQLGAKVHGYALDPPTKPSLFESADIGSILASDTRSDLADLAALKSVLGRVSPEVIFHLAAQPLVREGYRDPLGTLTSNIMGTAHVLEAARASDSVRAIVLITTDKVYENREWVYPYREADALGGHDPYSASKAAAEIVAATYRASFFGSTKRHPARVATTRAGNVLGGGDWANERLVPDCLRAFEAGTCVRLRFPDAVRPWQHVLEPLAGYLQLAEKLMRPEAESYATAWNFGPDVTGDASVHEVAEIMAKLWGNGARVECEPSDENPREAGLLRLDSTLARVRLGWRPRWSLSEALARTVDWHRAWMRGDDISAVSLGQIRDYQSISRA